MPFMSPTSIFMPASIIKGRLSVKTVIIVVMISGSIATSIGIASTIPFMSDVSISTPIETISGSIPMIPDTISLIMVGNITRGTSNPVLSY